MKLDKFSPLGSPKMEESEIPPLLAAARREGTQMAREVGGLRLPPGTRLPVLIVSLSDWIPACSLDPASVLKCSGFKAVC